MTGPADQSESRHLSGGFVLFANDFSEYGLSSPQHPTDVRKARPTLGSERGVLLQFIDGGSAGGIRLVLQTGEGRGAADAAVDSDWTKAAQDRRCGPHRPMAVVPMKWIDIKKPVPLFEVRATRGRPHTQTCARCGAPARGRSGMPYLFSRRRNRHAWIESVSWLSIGTVRPSDQLNGSDFHARRDPSRSSSDQWILASRRGVQVDYSCGYSSGIVGPFTQTEAPDSLTTRPPDSAGRGGFVTRTTYAKEQLSRTQEVTMTRLGASRRLLEIWMAFKDLYDPYRRICLTAGAAATAIAFIPPEPLAITTRIP